VAAASTASTDAAADVYGPRMTANAAIKRVTRERRSVQRKTHTYFFLETQRVAALAAR
jgi:hypothetical protein